MELEWDDARVPSAITLVLPEVELYLGFFPAWTRLGLSFSLISDGTEILPLRG